MTATFDDGEKSGVLAVSGGGVDIQRSLSNTIAHVDGAVSVPPTDAEKNQAVATHDINNKIIDEERQVDDRSDATAVGDQEDDGSGGAAPDGGLQAWMVVLGAWCASFCSYGWINSMSTLTFLFFLLALRPMSNMVTRCRYFPAILRRRTVAKLLGQSNLVDPRAANLLHVLHGPPRRRPV